MESIWNSAFFFSSSENIWLTKRSLNLLSASISPKMHQALQSHGALLKYQQYLSTPYWAFLPHRSCSILYLKFLDIFIKRPSCSFCPSFSLICFSASSSAISAASVFIAFFAFFQFKIYIWFSLLNYLLFNVFASAIRAAFSLSPACFEFSRILIYFAVGIFQSCLDLIKRLPCKRLCFLSLFYWFFY